MKRSIVIIVFSTIFLIFSIFVFFTKVVDEDKATMKREKLNQHNQYTKADFDEIVSDVLGLGVLVNKKSLSEMNNAERLRMLISQYKGKDRYETFSQTEIDKIHSNSLIKNLNVTYENLYDYYGTFTWNNSNIAYQYDSVAGTFKYTGALGHGGVSKGNIIHKDLVTLDTNGKTYTVKYRYIFYNTSGDGPSDVKLFLNIDDALNDKNEWAYLPVKEDNSAHANEYVDMHYKEVKDSLPIYTYIFKMDGSNLVITDFFIID